MPGDIEELRPTSLWGATYRVDSGHGKMFINITRLDGDDGTPGQGPMREVFVKVSSNMPPGIGKGGTPEELAAVIIATSCNRAEAEVLGKLISTALGAGAPAEELAHLLLGVDCGHPLMIQDGRLFEHSTVTSMADAVGRVMMYDIQLHQQRPEQPPAAQAQAQES